MKKFLTKYWWIVLMLLIVFGLFYWFQLRPTQIRKECSEVASKSSSQYKVDETIQRLQNQGVYFNEALYQKCLREHGLEK